MLARRGSLRATLRAAVGAALVLPGAIGVGADARASEVGCVCIATPWMTLPETGAEGAPLGTRVQARVGPSRSPKVVELRAQESGATVQTRSRSTSTGPGLVTEIELTPLAPLAPSTRYLVVLVDPTQTPAITVFGTFRTGAGLDTVAPTLDPPGAVDARKDLKSTDTCSQTAPRVTIHGLRAADPGRPGAHLAMAIWKGNEKGVVDDTRPPDLLAALEESVTIGGTTPCYRNPLPLPSAGRITLGIAAVDESGNRSALRRITADMTAAPP